MVQLLISVRSAAEAAMAVEAADVLDLKSPADGPLGAVSASTADGICNVVGPWALMTAAAGELIDWPASSSRKLLEVDRLSVLKLGPASFARQADFAVRWAAAAREIAAAGKQLAAVAYADHLAAEAPPPIVIVEQAVLGSAPYLLIDTWDKGSGGLLDHLSADQLGDLFSAARRAGIQTVAAGSLQASDLRRLPRETIDIVAIRGAACSGDRRGDLCPQRIAQFRQALDQWSLPVPTH